MTCIHVWEERHCGITPTLSWSLISTGSSLVQPRRLQYRVAHKGNTTLNHFLEMGGL